MCVISTNEHEQNMLNTEYGMYCIWKLNCEAVTYKLTFFRKNRTFSRSKVKAVILDIDRF